MKKHIFGIILGLATLGLMTSCNSGGSSSSSTINIFAEVTGLQASETVTFSLYNGLSMSNTTTATATKSVSTNQKNLIATVERIRDDVLVPTTQPTNSVCTVNNPYAYAPTNDVTFSVTCSTTSHTMTVTVEGLDDDTLSLSLNRNVSMDVEGDGEYTFDQTLADGSTYNLTQVSVPKSHRCEFSSSTGTATDDIAVTLTCQRANIIFTAKSTVYLTGDFGGREVADNYCQDYIDSITTAECDQVVGFLSVSEDDQIVDYPTNYNFDSSLPVYSGYANPAGSEGMRDRIYISKIADNWDDLLDGTLDNVFDINDFWTGTNADGTVADNNCDGWTSTSGTSNISKYYATDSKWIADSGTCSTKHFLGCACLQNAVAQPATANYLFHTGSAIDADFGDRDAANTLCETAQSTNHSDLTCDGVVAFVSYDSSDEIQDFPTLYTLDQSMEILDADNDNAVIANDWADLLDGDVDTGLTESWWSGTFVSSVSDLHGETSDFDCANWTSTDGASDATVGAADATDDFWAGTSDGMCDEQHHLMCLCYQQE